MARQAYIARYPSPEVEEILYRDTFWSPNLTAKMEALAEIHKPGDAPIQGWYSDETQTVEIARIG